MVVFSWYSFGLDFVELFATFFGGTRTVNTLPPFADRRILGSGGGGGGSFGSECFVIGGIGGAHGIFHVFFDGWFVPFDRH